MHQRMTILDYIWETRDSFINVHAYLTRTSTYTFTGNVIRYEYA